MRLVASEQRTQRPVAFTKTGTLIRPRNKTVPIPHTDWSSYETVTLERIGGERSSFKKRMLNAVEASAGIPGVFPLETAIEKRGSKKWTGFYVDGGVNDILPRRYAGALNGIPSPLSREPIHFLSIYVGTVDVDNEATLIEEKRLYKHKFDLEVGGSGLIFSGEQGNARQCPLNFPKIRPSWRWKESETPPDLVKNIAQGLFSALAEISHGDIREGQAGSGKNITFGL